MKTELTNVDIYVLVKELGYSRIEKLTRIQVGYKLKAHPGRDLLVVGGLAIPTQYAVQSLPPDNLCKVFRKYLAGARVLSIEQLNFDRILRISTDRGSVVLELFGHGNIILTDPEGRILYAKEQREWSARKILRGEVYAPPPPPKIRPDMGYEEFSRLFTHKDVVRSLVRAGFPPAYAEEVCLRADVKKDTPVSGLRADTVERLYSAFQELFRSLKHPTPVAYMRGDDIVDITPIPLEIYRELKQRMFPTLSDALDLLTPHILSSGGEEKKKEKKEDLRTRLMAEREKILREMEELEKMIVEAYKHAHELITQMQNVRDGGTPEAVGPFRPKRWNRREIVYSFTPPA